MHVCLLGVASTMLSAWLDNVGELYYLPPIKVKELNSRIEGFHLPCNVTRIFRTTKYVIHWKANELRQFILESPILLVNVLPTHYYNHW